MLFSLPYYLESDQLPGPLPEQHEMDHAAHCLLTIRNPDYGGRLVIIRDLYVVRYGPYVAENEGYALLSIEQELSIPAPRPYAMYRQVLYRHAIYPREYLGPGMALPLRKR